MQLAAHRQALRPGLLQPQGLVARCLPNLGRLGSAQSSHPRQTRVRVAEIDRLVAPLEVVSEASSTATDVVTGEFEAQVALRKQQRAREQLTYQMSAIAASLGVMALAFGATYYKFMRHVDADSPFPWLDMAGTLLLVFGGVVGMEMWARFAHKALWHEFQPGWALHKSHHEPRVGPFEANDVFAIMNALPAFGLCLYGFLTPSIGGSLCFGAGLGITLFGMMYMFFHDGLVHKRFPVGPIADWPVMKRVTVAHKLHHSEKYGGVPWGMFLGPQELEAIGAGEELDRLVAQLDNKGL